MVEFGRASDRRGAPLQRCIAAVASGILVACASPSEPGAPVAERSFAQALAREADLPESRRLASDDGFFSAQVGARLVEPLRFAEDRYYAQLDVGSEVPIRCSFFRGRLDMASALALASESAFRAIGESLGRLEARQIHRIDAGAVGDAPFLSIAWLYRLHDGARPVVGQLKQVIATKGQRSVACQHDEVGYVQTFDRLFADIMSSIRYAAETGWPPFYREIWTASVGPQRLGVQQLTLTLQDSGDARMESALAMLVPIGSDRARVTDSYRVEYSTSDGVLIQASEVKAEDNAITTNLDLLPQPDGSWRVSGRYQSKPFDASLQPAGHLLSYLGQTWQLRRALRLEGVAAAVSTPVWDANADPSRLVDATTTITGAVGDGDYSATFTLGELRMEGVVDARGSMKSARMGVGEVTLDHERIFVEGDL
jgi:hypothetical protein